MGFGRKSVWALITVGLIAAACTGGSTPPGAPTAPPSPGSITGACGFTVQQTATTLPAAYSGGSLTVDVTTTNAGSSGSNCTWNVSLTAEASAFVTLASPADGRSTAARDTVRLDVAPNVRGGRRGDVIIAGVPFTVTQEAAPCQLVVQGDLDRTFPAAGGTGNVTITNPQGVNCSWTATTAAAFITLNPPTSGVGPGAVTFTVANNTGGSRTGTVTVADRTATVSQAAGLGTDPQLHCDRLEQSHYTCFASGLTPFGRFRTYQTCCGANGFGYNERQADGAGNGVYNVDFPSGPGVVLPITYEEWVVDLTTGASSSHVFCRFP